MAVGTAQESRLAIVIDTKDSEAKIKKLRDALNGLGGTANTAGAGANAAGAGAQRLGRDVSVATTAVQRLTQSMGSLSGVFASFASVAGVMSVIKTADAMQSLNSKIKLATSSSEEYLAVQGRLRAMAQSNLTQYDSLVELYASSRRALRQLGKTQNETLDFTDNLTKAMFIGGGAAASQAAALVQLQQALSAGGLRGEEFNSVAEQAPILLELIAEKMGVAQGALRKMAADGKISTKIIYESISDATQKLDEMVAKMPATMGQAFETVRNQWKYFVDDMLNGTDGFSSLVASSLISIGQNLNSLIPILVAGGLAWGAYALATSTAAATGMAAAINGMMGMGMWLTSTTMLIDAKILSMFNLAAMYNAWQVNMMLASLTLANYVDIVKTSVLALKAKAFALGDAARAAAINAAWIIVDGQATATLAAAAKGAASAIMQKVAAMRAGVTWSSAYAASLTVVAGAAAVTGAAVKGVGLALARLGGIINAHPILFLAGVLLSVVAASKDAEGKMLGLSGALSSLSEAVNVVAYMFVDFINLVVDGAKLMANMFGSWITSMITNSETGTEQSDNMFSQFFENTEGGFVGLIQVWARVSDFIAVVARSLVETLIRGFFNLATDVANKASYMGNALVDAFNWAARGVASTLNFMLDGISAVVSGLNKLPFVNISDDKVRYTARQAAQFKVDRPLDNTSFGETFNAQAELQKVYGLAEYVNKKLVQVRANSKLVTADLDAVSAALANSGDEAKKAGNKKAAASKKVKEAIDKERQAYEKLLQSFDEQMASYDKEHYMAKMPFPTEFADATWEMTHQLGKFYDLPTALKDAMAKAAADIDKVRVSKSAIDTVKDLKREFELLGEENPVKHWMHDFDDVTNILSTLGDDFKLLILETVTSLDFKKHALDIADMNKEVEKQLMILEGVTDLDREKLEIDYEHNEFLKRFAYLQKLGNDAAYESLKTDLDRWRVSKELLAIKTREDEANKSVASSLESINKEIALFGNTDAMAEFNYELDVMKKYAGASAEQIERLRAAFETLQALKAGDAFGDLLKRQDGSSESPVGRLVEQYKNDLKVIEDFELKHVELLENSAAARLDVEKAYQRAKFDLITGSGEAMFGDLASMAKDFAGEQSTAYRALFAVEKGFAIAQSAMAIQQAVAKAMAVGFPQNIPFIGQAISQGASIMSNLRAIAPQGFKQGGYTGGMGVNDVAGVVHGQEYVFDAQATKRIGVDNLNAMRSGKSIGGGVGDVNITVNVDAQGNSSMSGDTANSFARGMGQAMEATAINVINKELRQGGIIDKRLRR